MKTIKKLLTLTVIVGAVGTTVLVAGCQTATTSRHVPEGSPAGPIGVSDEGGHDSKAAAACQSTRWRQGLSREVQRKSVLRLSDREEGKDLRGEPGAVQCV